MAIWWNMPKLMRSELLAGCLLAIGLLISVPPVYALFDSPVDRLPVAADRVALRQGKVLVQGEKGNYVARVLVAATPELAWAVLTDYSNFSRFIPNVVSSKILETQGNQKVIEQEDVRQLLFVNVRSRVRSAITETPQTRIDFRRIDGDVPKLDGYWKVEPVAADSGVKADQVLITEVVAVQPKSGLGADVFYNIFKNSLRDNLAAIQKEMSRRTP
jgi:ribosome-associated toxin RatA of RatAB toxin-antitoxin module